MSGAAAHNEGMTTSSTKRNKDVGAAGNGGHFAAKEQGEPAGLELSNPNGPDPDMSWWDEDERALPASLYEAGLDGTLEPYNGDYPVKDGALRYWREDMTRELLIGERADGTTVVAVEAEAHEDIYISEDVGVGATPAQINAAIDTVRERAAHLPPPEGD